jgi:hypothetical protein
MTPINRSGCPARLHGTRHARYRLGCTCPDAAEDMRTYGRERMRRWRAGLPPLNDSAVVDGLAVDLACRGESVRLTRAEKALAVARLTEGRLSAAAIAARLHVSARTVQRYRRQIREVAA